MSWAKLTPRTIQSDAKNRSGPTGKGNPYLKGVLGEAAAAAARTGTFLGERYRRIVKHCGKLKALVAVARSILVIVWHLLANPIAATRTSAPATTPAASTKTANPAAKAQVGDSLGAFCPRPPRRGAVAAVTHRRQPRLEEQPGGPPAPGIMSPCDEVPQADSGPGHQDPVAARLSLVGHTPDRRHPMTPITVVLAIWIIGVYSLPSIIAMSRKVPHIRSVILANVFVGWTFVGWVMALRMACQSKTRPVQSYFPRDG